MCAAINPPDFLNVEENHEFTWNDLPDTVQKDIISLLKGSHDTGTLIALSAVVDSDRKAELLSKLAGLPLRKNMLLKSIEYGCSDAFAIFANKVGDIRSNSDLAPQVLRSALLGQSPALSLRIINLLLRAPKISDNGMKELLRRALNPSRTSTADDIVRAAAAGQYPSPCLVNLRIFFQKTANNNLYLRYLCRGLHNLKLGCLIYLLKAVVAVDGVLTGSQRQNVIAALSASRAVVAETVRANRLADIKFLVGLGFPIAPVSKPWQRVVEPTALFYSARLAVLERDYRSLDTLLALGADLDSESGIFSAALYLATALGDVKTAERLLAAGANFRRFFHFQDESFAEWEGSYKEFKHSSMALDRIEKALRVVMVAPADVYRGCRPIELAVFNNDAPLVELLSKAMSADGMGYAAPKRWDALKHCVLKGNLDILQSLIAIG